MSARLSVLREGGLQILVPDKPGGKISSRMPAFYNPRMITNRDMSVICAESYARTQTHPICVCDLLSATGIRGLRYLGLKSVQELYMNDIGKTAFDLMYRNLEMNFATHQVEKEEGLVSCKVDGKKVWITNREALLFLAEYKHTFHLLDLDPFGSPANFIPSCLKALRHGSMFCVTATDTAPLCGTYPKTCTRRYGSLSLKTGYKHETGLRILIGHIVRRAASMDIGTRPLFSHATAHYYRIYLSIRGSRSAADRALGMIGWAAHCSRCNSRLAHPGFLPPTPRCCDQPMTVFGPLWIGPLKDDRFVRSMINVIGGEDGEASEIVLKVSREIDTFSFYDIHIFARMLGMRAPRTSEVMRVLKENGYRVSPTHITGTGLKTDASSPDLCRIITQLARA